jgi:Tfp pilus assembly protein PilF
MKTIDPDTKIELFMLLSEDSVFFKKHHKQLDLLVEQLFEKYPDHFRVRLANADRNMRQMNYMAAKDDLLFVVTRMPINYFLWEHLLQLISFLEDYETLYETSRNGLQYFDDRYIFHFLHGFSASMLKKYDCAIDAYYKALTLLETEKEFDLDLKLQAYVFLAEACNEQRRFEESDFAFEKALEMAPNNRIILNNYSYYLSLREEKLDIALKYIERCIAMESNNSTFLDTYGWVLYKLGRLDDAIVMIERAMEFGGGDSPEIVEHYCELLTVAERFSEAYHICKYAIELKNIETTVEEKIEEILRRK